MLTTTDQQRWFVVATQPAKEQLATDQLRLQGMDSFMPTFRKTLRIKERSRDVIRPLFPGYVFVSLDRDLRKIRSVNGTRGVKRLVGFTGGACPLPVGFVEAMQANLNDDGTISHRATFSVGARVELATGPFAKRIGEIIAMDDRGRVTVLLEFLSTQVPVSTRASELLPA